MTHGTPASVPTSARLTLQTATTALPTTAMKAILMSVRLTGGATSPLRRRRLSRSHKVNPSNATMTPIAIQPSVGSIVPHMRL